MRNPFRKRYDPWPDLKAAYFRLLREAESEAKEDPTPGAIESCKRRLDIASKSFKSRTIYCTMGKDRKKLGPEYVEDFEADVREMWGRSA